MPEAADDPQADQHHYPGRGLWNDLHVNIVITQEKIGIHIVSICRAVGKSQGQSATWCDLLLAQRIQKGAEPGELVGARSANQRVGRSLRKSFGVINVSFLPGLKGRMDISRWRQPPVINRRNHPPRKGRRRISPLKLPFHRPAGDLCKSPSLNNPSS